MNFPLSLSPQQPQTRIKCLVVDDIAENLIALEALLQRDDIDVLKASCGPEALELLLQHSDVALALLDVQMPGMNGFELAELIRGSERTRHVPLIFMTAGSRDQNWQFTGYETGAVDFLYKPIDPHMLTNKADVFFELHRQKRAVAQQLQERTEALRLNEMFMAVLSHDLRNPLTAILASAKVMQRAPDLEKVSALAEKVLSIGQRMGRMIEDLLDITRVRHAGGLSLKLATAHLGEIAQHAAHELHATFPERSIETTMEGDLNGYWDAERLAQVASNLIGNAVHHGASDQPVEIFLDGTAAEKVELRIRNSGTIPSSLLPHIFDPFRGRQHKSGPQQGLGLGLYIVQQIVLAHGGNINVCSQDGHTIFCVQLPRVSHTPKVFNG